MSRTKTKPSTILNDANPTFQQAAQTTFAPIDFRGFDLLLSSFGIRNLIAKPNYLLIITAKKSKSIDKLFTFAVESTIRQIFTHRLFHLTNTSHKPPHSTEVMKNSSTVTEMDNISDNSRIGQGEQLVCQ